MRNGLLRAEAADIQTPQQNCDVYLGVYVTGAYMQHVSDAAQYASTKISQVSENEVETCIVRGPANACKFSKCKCSGAESY